MASLNSVCLLGHLTRNPEVRYSATGTPVAALGLAVDHRIKRSDDSGQTWARMPMWRKYFLKEHRKPWQAARI